MKKLFSYFMVAALALTAACTTPEGSEDENKKPANQSFYGFEVENINATVVGEDTFIFQMFTVNANGQPERTLSAQVVVPGVGEDLVIPEGTYELIPGEVDATNNYIIGSFYQNSVSNPAYIMTVAEGELEIKHTAQGYMLTVYNASGTTVWEEAPREIKGIGIRYTGDIALYGNVFPTTNTEGAALYYGGFDIDDETTAYYWQLQFDITETIWASLYFNAAVDDFEAGIPSGKYLFDWTGKVGTADMTSFDQQYGYYGSMILIDEEDGTYIYDTISGGEVELVNNGNGTYEVSVLFYNGMFVPYEMYFNGSVQLYDQRKPSGPIEVALNLDEAEVTYLDWGTWGVNLSDSEYNNGAGAKLYLELTDGMEVTFADGITSTTFTIEEGYGDYTITPGEYVEEENAIYGASIWSFANQPYDYLTEGTLVVTNNGNGTYKFEVDMTGVQGHFTGTYEGEPTMEDLTAEEGVVARAKVPAMNAAKSHAKKVTYYQKANFETPRIETIIR